MTKLVERAVAAISRLPPETQDDLARFMLAIVRGIGPLGPDEATAVAEGESELARGERVSADAIQAFWRSNGQ